MNSTTPKAESFGGYRSVAPADRASLLSVLLIALCKDFGPIVRATLVDDSLHVMLDRESSGSENFRDFEIGPYFARPS